MRAVPSSFLFPFFLSSFFFLLFLFLFSALPTTNQLVDRFFSSNNAQGRWSHEDDYLIVVSPGCKRSSFTFNHFTIPAYLATAHHRVSPSIFVVTSRTTFSKGVRTSTPTFTALHSVFPTISSPLIYSTFVARAPSLEILCRYYFWNREIEIDGANQTEIEKEWRKNRGYSSSYRRIERVRSSVFKSGQSPAEFCSSSKFTRGNYTDCNRFRLVRRAHTKPRCVPFQPLLPKFHPFNIPKFFQSNK